MIPLTDRVEQYLAQREAFGTGLSERPPQVLRKFAAFAVEQGAVHVTTELCLLWKERCGSANRQSWAGWLTHVRTFARWLQSLEPATEVPPYGLIPASRIRPRPYIYTDEEIGRIVGAAAHLDSKQGLPRSHLLHFVRTAGGDLGLRPGEALGLDDGDVDTGECLLHVRKAKNGRCRMVPVTPCTATRLEGYRSLRNRVLGPLDTPAFFVGENRRRISRAVAKTTFARVGQEIGLREKHPSGFPGKGPRLYDLRHTVATRTLIDWYRAGLDADREMYKLTTWLGHKRPEDTYWYTEAVPELLQLATERAEQALAQGRQS